MGATETLARFIADSRYDDLPPEAVEAAKVGIMDGVANMLAGSTQPLADIVVVRGDGAVSNPVQIQVVPVRRPITPPPAPVK